jgi:hypothetical protein
MTYINCVLVEVYLAKALIHAYPDPNHRIRHLYRYLISHCFCILACLALVSTGITRDEIIYHLIWDSDTVDFYIRESHQLVSNLCAAILKGTFMRGTAYLCANL